MLEACLVVSTIYFVAFLWFSKRQVEIFDELDDIQDQINNINIRVKEIEKMTENKLPF